MASKKFGRRRARGPIWIFGLIGSAWACGGTEEIPSRALGTPENPKELHVYIGTYTRGKSKGIYRYRLDLETGRLTSTGVTAGVENPSFLALHPDGRKLYAVNEIGNYEGKKSGAVSAFAIDPATGELRFLNRRASGGGAPCHLVVDRTGKNVLVANYSGGSVAVLRVETDGRLGATSAFVQHEGSSVNPRRQEAPHAHSINLDPANRFALAADLGLDEVLVYRFDAGRGTLESTGAPAGVEPGSGPRHLAFHPSGRYVYVINELSSTASAFAYDAARGTLKSLETVSTLPAGVQGGNSTAEVQVHPSGRFLYGSNRGHDSIAVFAIDLGDGTLKRLENEPTGGKTPRNFGIDPTGRYLLAANQASDSIVVFRIDPQTGELERTGERVEVPTPVCIKFLPVESSS